MVWKNTMAHCFQNESRQSLLFLPLSPRKPWDLYPKDLKRSSSRRQRNDWESGKDGTYLKKEGEEEGQGKKK